MTLEEPRQTTEELLSHSMELAIGLLNNWSEAHNAETEDTRLGTILSLVLSMIQRLEMQVQAAVNAEART